MSNSCMLSLNYVGKKCEQVMQELSAQEKCLQNLAKINIQRETGCAFLFAENNSRFLSADSAVSFKSGLNRRHNP
jgi:hypothetical protein